jgi:hypothetical protein
VLLSVLCVPPVLPGAMLVEQHEGRIAATCTCTGTHSFYTNTGDIVGKWDLLVVVRACIKLDERGYAAACWRYLFVAGYGTCSMRPHVHSTMLPLPPLPVTSIGATSRCQPAPMLVVLRLSFPWSPHAADAVAEPSAHATR